MIQIRSGVFETNSSSMHSLVIKRNGNYYQPEELTRHLWIHNGVWKLYREDGLSFGRAPFDCLSTFEAKVRYAIASLCGYRQNAAEIFKEIEELVCDIVPECTHIELPEQWYYEFDDDDNNDDEDHIFYGHVDEDILTPFLKNNNVSLREFLTNSKYIVIVDGDEYCIWSNMKKSGLVNLREIEKEYG